MPGNVPPSGCRLMGAVTYLDLPLPHDLVHDLIVVLVEHAFVVTLLVAQDAQVLGAFQLDFKLLSRRRQHRRRENEWPAEAQGISVEHQCLSGQPTSFHCGSVVSLNTLVLALLTKYPYESTSRVQ